MGLDCTAYNDMVLLPEHPHLVENEECYNAGHVYTYPSKFPRSERGTVMERCYERTSATEAFAWSAGSYSSYNAVRAAISEAALAVSPREVWNNPEDYKHAPFFELINFSDCEGTIGTEAARDLAVDFDSMLGTMIPKLEEIERRDGAWEHYYVGAYMEWKRACELASLDGFIVFH